MFNLSLEQSIYVQANGFHKAADLLNSPLGGTICMTALVANSAFASELYLKCLILLETKQLMKDEHDLRKLFSKLSKDTQTTIENHFDADVASGPQWTEEMIQEHIGGRRPPKNLREALKEGGNAFVRWRYIYEDSETRYFMLLTLPPILVNTIMTRKPEWRGFTLRANKVAGPLPTSPAQKTQESSAVVWPVRAGSR